MNLVTAALLVGTAATARPQTLTDGQALQQRVAMLEARIARVERAPQEPPRSRFGVEITVPEASHWARAVAWNADLRVLGAVTGPAVAVGGDLWVGPDGYVSSNLVSLGGTVHTHPDAVVHGEAISLPSVGDAPNRLTRLARRASSFLALAGLVLLQVNFAEQRTRNIADTVRTSPFWHTLAGAILVTASLAGGAVALASLVAAPIGLALLGLLAVAGSLGLAGFCRFIGDSLPITHLDTPRVAAVAGITLLGLLTTLPVFGLPLAFAAALSGTGAAVVSRLGRRAAMDI